MKITRRELFKQLRNVLYGKKLLSGLIRKYNINLNIDFVVVLPEDDLYTNILVLLYLNMLVKQFEKNKDELEGEGRFVVRENEKFLILVRDERLIHDAKILFPRMNNIVVLSDFDMQAILARHCFIPFDNRIIIASINEENGTNYMGLLSKKNISLNEIIAVAVIGISRDNFLKWRIPKVDIEQIENDDVLNQICSKGYATNEK